MDGILTSTDSAIAANDFAGYDNTQLMLATDVSGAGYSCANFVFPNGDKGYLPAFGELEEALLKKSKINSVMVLIGGEGFAIGTYWSSTQQDRLNSWVLNSINGGAGISSKNGTVNVRAFSRL